ncbi:MAG TPA: bacterioferritin-associated ferredoxin [Solimonas sp.]
MFVCVCKAVSDRQIRRAVREDGVTSLRELAKLHGVGTGCGKCVPHARALLGETLAEMNRALPQDVDVVVPAQRVA